jgi:hypothetical protein
LKNDGTEMHTIEDVICVRKKYAFVGQEWDVDSAETAMMVEQYHHCYPSSQIPQKLQNT